MKKFYLSLLVLSFFFADLSAQCVSGTALVDLDVNNVRAGIRTAGDMWWDGANGRYIIPNVEVNQKSALFCGGIWMGGIDQGGFLHLAAQTYGAASGQDEFFPGPINELTGTTNPDICNDWDMIFQTKKVDIDLHIADLLDNGVIDGPIPFSILRWPAKGNPFFLDEVGFQLPNQDLAPFYDVNEDGFYDPQDGDFPLIKGNQAEWWIYNDIGGVHENSGGANIGMEIKGTAFGFSDYETYIDNVTFYEYEFKYRGVQPLDSFYFSIWVDPDLGCHIDDYIGCDPSRDLGYVYNGDDDDANCLGVNGYGTEIPVVGVKAIKKPMNADGDEVPMAHFTYYFNGGLENPPPGTTDPGTANQYYNYMTGSWLDGTPVTQGGNGYNPTGDPYPYVFDGSDVDGLPWTECTALANPGDRRFIMSFGPLSLQPGDVKKLVFAVLFEPNVIHPCPDLSALFASADDVGNFYEEACEDYDQIVSVREALDEMHAVTVFPNPAAEEAVVTISSRSELIENVQLFGTGGQLVLEQASVQSQVFELDRSLSEGVYFYRVLLQDGRIETGKLMIQ